MEWNINLNCKLVLNVTKECKEIEIKKQYKKLALLLHPDKNKAPKSEDAFKKISQAFSCLRFFFKKKIYKNWNNTIEVTLTREDNMN